MAGIYIIDANGIPIATPDDTTFEGAMDIAVGVADATGELTRLLRKRADRACVPGSYCSTTIELWRSQHEGW